MSTRCLLPLFVALSVTATCLPSLSAATVAYWTMQGTAGTQASVVQDSSGNNLHGTGATSVVGTNLGVLPQFDSQSVGPLIYDPVSQTYASGTSSIRFTNTALPSVTNSAAGSQIKVAGNAAMNLQNFTMEGFVKLNQHVDFSTIVGKVRDGGNPTYNLDLGSLATHAVRLRSDHNALDAPYSNGTPGWNQGFNSTAGGTLSTDTWYHIAFTFQQGNPDTLTAGKFQMYVNGVNVTSGSGALTGGEIYSLVYTNSDLLFGALAGGRAFDGWMSHFRLSDTVLSTSQFLRVVPEPSAALLSCFALGLVAVRRRRQNDAI